MTFSFEWCVHINSCAVCAHAQLSHVCTYKYVHACVCVVCIVVCVTFVCT